MKDKGITFKDFWAIGPRRLGDTCKLLDEKFAIILPDIPAEKLDTLSRTDLVNLLYEHQVFSKDEIESFALLNIVCKWCKIKRKLKNIKK